MEVSAKSKVKKTQVAARTDLPPSDALSIVKMMIPGLETKIIGCLVADGSDAKALAALSKAITSVGAGLKIVAPKIGGAVAADGSVIGANFQLAGGSSVLFDAVYVALSKTGARSLSTEAAAVAWVHDAFAHLKVVGASPASQALLDAAGVGEDEGIVLGGSSKTYLERVAAGRIWSREPNV